MTLLFKGYQPKPAFLSDAEFKTLYSFIYGNKLLSTDQFKAKWEHIVKGEDPFLWLKKFRHTAVNSKEHLKRICKVENGEKFEEAIIDTITAFEKTFLCN